MLKCGFNYTCITIYGRCKSRNELIFSFCVAVCAGVCASDACGWKHFSSSNRIKYGTTVILSGDSSVK